MRIAMTTVALGIAAYCSPVQAQSYWYVAPDGAPSGGLVPVRAVPVYLTEDPCLFMAPFCVGANVASLQVTPCVPGAACQDGTTTLSFPVSGFLSVPLQLAAGTSYTFSGFWFIEKLFPDCSFLACTYGDSFDARVFPEPTVSVREAGWGFVKQLYRE